jgi:hypothetical protein
MDGLTGACALIQHVFQLAKLKGDASADEDVPEMEAEMEVC